MNPSCGCVTTLDLSKNVERSLVELNEAIICILLATRTVITHRMGLPWELSSWELTAQGSPIFLPDVIHHHQLRPVYTSL